MILNARTGAFFNGLHIKKIFPVLLSAFLILIFSQNASELSAADASAVKNDGPWSQLPVILKRIVPPVFQNKDFIITDYGAIADGKTNCTEAFKAAIDACNTAGGGRVVVPSGKWVTGAIHLKSNVNLYVSKGAIIIFSWILDRYLPVVLTRYESVECMNYSPLIYAYNQKNIAITGEGTLSGGADRVHWWNWKSEEAEDNKNLKEMAKNGIPAKERVFGNGHVLRVNFIEPYLCQNVLIEGVTIVRSPMWEIEPVQCTNVIIQNVKIDSHGPNNDGIDPQSCTDVLIKNCTFDTGDDCIAIKAGRDYDGRRLNIPCQNIVIQDCHMKDGHGGITVGSETSGSIRNVFAENCDLDSPNLWMAIRLKSNSVRGGTIENIYIRNIKVGKVRDAVFHATMYYDPGAPKEGDTGDFTPIIRNISVQNVVCENSARPIFMEGYERSKISNVEILSCDFKNPIWKPVLKNTSNVSFKNTKINGEDVKE
jgi:polygalacturonase